ncbi:MAG TPA: DUF1648 domain-containing protein [Gemmatimonadaceae bacterium]|jgi:uncharacterized membrane protein|nr:DUF1648 domain-containing protein [Gemmatimonadaceae bacterium]
MRKWIPAALIIAAVVISIVAYPDLPERMPTHWGANGEVNGWSSRLWGAWMVPLIMAAMWLLLRAIPHIDPRKANYEKFAGMYDAFIILILGFLLVMHGVVVAAATGSDVKMDKIVMPLVGVFIAAMGFLIPRAAPNWFIGIRTPWTLTSDESWVKTHKLGGPLFVALGLVMALSSLIAPEQAIWILVAAAIGIVIFLFIYSYRVWKADPLKR